MIDVFVDTVEVAVHLGMKRLVHYAMDFRRAAARSLISRTVSGPSSG
jgi:hypothetical protein